MSWHSLFASKVGRPDPEALFAEIAHTGYRDEDRYREFRRVFLGSDEGRRVLYEILSWGHMFQSSVSRTEIDPNRVMFLEGERNLALKLLATLNAEPTARPEQVTRAPASDKT
jgi:hypothetical protein